MSDEIAASPAVVAAINAHLGDEVTTETIALVLGAWNDVQAGPPVGTIARNKETGAIAHRVEVDGRHMWRCSSPTGESWNDLQPVLAGWEIL